MVQRKLKECRRGPQGENNFVKENIGNPNENKLHKSLKCLYTNLNGLNNKVAELDKENPYVIFLTETKTSPDMLNLNLCNTNWFTVVRKDRISQNSPEGGVAILVKRHLIVDESPVTKLSEHSAEETVWCEVRSEKGKNLVLGCIYRAPSSPARNNDLICDVIRLSENTSKEKQLLVYGKFNFGNIIWEEYMVVDGSQGYDQATNFLKAICDNFWTKNVHEWTHLRETENPSRFDLIFSKTNSEVEDIRYLSPLSMPFSRVSLSHRL